MGNLPEYPHLNDLLDDALAGTFPASDPTSSFVCEGERPKDDRNAPEVNAALLVERSEAEDARKFATSLPAAWREAFEPWFAGSSRFFVLVELPDRMLVGTPDAIADIRGIIDIARAEDEGAILHMKFMCTDVTAAAIIDDPVIAAVDWSTPPRRRQFVADH